MLHLHLPHPSNSNSFAYSRFNHTRYFRPHFIPFHAAPPNFKFSQIPSITSRIHNHTHIKRFASHNAISLPTTSAQDDASIIDNPTENQKHNEAGDGTTFTGNSFWGAVSLIIGTAVGPGILGLPAATIKSGPFPSTIVILLSWVYVVSSIILVAELSFAAMEEDGIEEVSFTSLATKALGNQFGAFVALIYASLSFSLLVACVSGIGSIVSQWFPWMNVLIVHSLFPLFVGTVLIFFPFKAIDAANRILCFIMLLSITTLVAVGLFVARSNIISSFAYTSWSPLSILPAIPVTVLTLGFHVITPFICKIAGNTLLEARKAILVGGTVPLVMVLSWNLIVLGLAGANTAATIDDPISLLLSVNPSALSAVQGFAFSALGTSLIGYAVSFPKQLLDTLLLICGKTKSKAQSCFQLKIDSNQHGNGKVGLAFYFGASDNGSPGKVSFRGSRDSAKSGTKMKTSMQAFDPFKVFIVSVVLGSAVLIASFFRSTFSRALDFAGVYANCFLFGILPPVMAYIHRSKKRPRSSILPGGDELLLLLFIVAVILGIWH